MVGYLTDIELIEKSEEALDNALLSNDKIKDVPRNYKLGSNYQFLVQGNLTSLQDMRDQYADIWLQLRVETMSEQSLELKLFEHSVPRKDAQKASVKCRIGRTNLNPDEIVAIEKGLNINFYDEISDSVKTFYYEDETVYIDEAEDQIDDRGYYTKELTFTSEESEDYTYYNGIPVGSEYEIGSNNYLLDTCISTENSGNGTNLESIDEMRDRASGISGGSSEWGKEWLKTKILGNIAEITYCEVYQNIWRDGLNHFTIIISNADNSLTEATKKKVYNLLLDSENEDGSAIFNIIIIGLTIKVPINFKLSITEELDIVSLKNSITNWFNNLDNGEDFIRYQFMSASFWSLFPNIYDVDYSEIPIKTEVEKGYRAEPIFEKIETEIVVAS